MSREWSLLIDSVSIWFYLELVLLGFSLVSTRIIRWMEWDLQKRRQLLAVFSHSRDRGPRQMPPSLLLQFFISKVEAIFLYMLNPSLSLLQRFILNIIQLFASSFTCAMFVYCFSSKHIPIWWPPLSILFFIVFAFDFTVRFLTHIDATWKYILSLPRLLDLLSMVSLLVSYDEIVSLVFIRAWVAVSMFNETKKIVERYLMFTLVLSQAVILITETAATIFIFSSIIMLLENIGNPPSLRDYDLSEFSFFNSVYFVFISFSTVGYGDITVTTVAGKVAIVFGVIIGLTLFLENLGRLASIVRDSSQGNGQYYKNYGDSFVLVCGTGNVNVLKDFLEDLFHPEVVNESTKALYQRIRVVILTKLDSEHQQAFFRALDSYSTKYNDKVVFLNGSPMDSNDLLYRARAREAEAVFVISNPNSIDTIADDTANLLRAMAIQRLSPRTPLFLCIQNAYFRGLVSSSSLRTKACVYSKRLAMEVLAISCFVPGFSTFLYNCLKSWGSKAHKALLRNSCDEICLNQRQYSEGSEKELFTIKLDSAFSGCIMAHTVMDIYKLSGGKVIMLAVASLRAPVATLENRAPDDAMLISEFSFDPSETILENAIALVLAQNRVDASEIGAPLAGNSSPIWQQNLPMASIVGLQNLMDEPLPSFSSPALDYNLSMSEHLKNELRNTVFPIPLSRFKNFSSKLIRTRLSPSESSETRDGEEKSNGKSEELPSRMRTSSDYALQSRISFDVPPPTLSSHIVIVCSSTREIGILIRRLRILDRSSHEKGNQAPILIISETDWSNSDFTFLRNSYLDMVYFLKGTLRHYSDFKRCRMEFAKRIVITNLHTDNLHGHIPVEVELTDVHTIFMWFRIKRYLEVVEKSMNKRAHRNVFDHSLANILQESKHGKILVELRNESSLKYFNNGDLNESEEICKSGSFLHMSVPLYSGEVYLHRLSSLMLSHSFVNPASIDFLLHLIYQSGRKHVLSFEPVDTQLHSSFGELFEWYLDSSDHRRIPFGLFRGEGDPLDSCGRRSPKKCSPFLLTGPPPSLKLHPKDFVLLIGGSIEFSSGVDPDPQNRQGSDIPLQTMFDDLHSSVEFDGRL